MGLIIVNIVQPGSFIEEGTRTDLMASFGVSAEANVGNITSDATMAILVGKSLGKLTGPKVKQWDDNLVE